MFLTDSFLCEYKFENLNHILIESNYIDEILEENVRNGLHYKVKRACYDLSHGATDHKAGVA